MLAFLAIALFSRADDIDNLAIMMIKANRSVDLSWNNIVVALSFVYHPKTVTQVGPKNNMSKLIELLRSLYPHTVEIDSTMKNEVKKWLRKNHIADFAFFTFERDGRYIMVVGFETEESHFFATMRYFNS